jgi:thiamine biosynthesis lipoprotein
MKLVKNVLFLLLFVIVFGSCSKTKPNVNELSGNVFGTTFHISYLDSENRTYEKQVDSLFYLVNKSLSTYMPESDISKINNGNTEIVVDKLFEEVYNKANRIFKETNGVFDPTIGVLVNAWGFGPKPGLKNLDSVKIKELLQFVGFDKVSLKEGRIQKKYIETYFDFNAIAKGYGVDVVGRFLEGKGVENYLIEIGGEVRVRGKNGKGEFWRIGIEKPNFDGTRSIQKVITLENEAMATSGNYRKYKIDSITGEKYVHTLDTKTGFTAKRDLLSASVISRLDCADVDGYATSFMAMGFKESVKFLDKHPELKAYLVYSGENGELKVFSTKGL